MSDLLERRPHFVFVLLFAFFALNVVLRVLLPASLELDEAEQMFVSQWLALGYSNQPPLYNWLQYGANAILGASVLSLSLLKNGMLFASYLLMGLTAFGVLRDKRLAVVASLGLFMISQIGYGAQRDLTHTVAVIFSSSLFLYGLFRTVERPSGFSYLLMGLAIGIGTISKYNFLLLPGSVFLAALWDDGLRRRIFDRRILLAALATLLIIVPHAVWFVENLDQATSRTLEKLTDNSGTGTVHQILLGLYSLTEALVGVSCLILLIFAAVFGRQMFAALRTGNRWTRLTERTWIVAFLALLSLILFFGVSEIRDRWLIPLVMPLPLYLCLKLEEAGADTSKPFRILLGIALAIMVIIPSVLGLRIVTAGWTGNYQKLNVPYGPMINQLMAEAPIPPAAIVAGDGQLAGTIRLHVSGVQILAPAGQQFFPDIAADRPILVIWRSGRKVDLAISPKMPGNVARFIERNLPDSRPEGLVRHVDVPYHYGAPGDTYRFYYQWMDAGTQKPES